MPKSRQVVGSKKAEKSEKSVESGRRESTPLSAAECIINREAFSCI